MRAQPARSFDLGPPALCKIGVDCFIQQFVDVDPGPGAKDSFCGAATYNGHDGTDLRIRSMADVARGVPVIAMQSGKVLRVRDGIADHLVASEEDEAAVRDRECGNGLVIEQTDALEVQYCHMKLGSLRVAPGDQVKKGDQLGDVGASGLAQFPHVHVTVRRGGSPVDPMSGHSLTEECGLGTTDTMFAPEIAAELGRGLPQLLDLGVTSGAVEEDKLVRDGRPADATAGSQAIVAWAWLINLAKGDQLTVTLIGPDGQPMSSQAVPPFDRKKSTYVAFAGKKRSPPAGIYTARVVLTGNDGKPIIDQIRRITIE